MRLFLDCEFTQLTAQAKLISLALVAEDGREFYVELLDSWRLEDCSDFREGDCAATAMGR